MLQIIACACSVTGLLLSIHKRVATLVPDLQHIWGFGPLVK